MMSKGSVVKSIAGHDKNKFYCVVGLDGDRALIADGRERRLEKPKAKNLKHLRPTTATLDLEVVTTNNKLKAALRPFHQALEGGGPQGGN